MHCPTKSLLLAEWQYSAESYAKAVSELVSQIGVLKKRDFESLKLAAEVAHDQAREAQARLDQHIADHGCNLEATA